MEKIEQFAADDWTDQDLLTRDEAAERLVEEIDVTKQELAALDSQGTNRPQQAEIDRLTKRLAALEAVERDFRDSGNGSA